MANHEIHIDDLLKDALGEYTEMPPAGAWADMEKRLAKADGAEHIDDVLHGALGNYTEAPPAAAWAEMEKMLEDKPSRRRPFAWFWYAAALTGVLLVAYMFLDKSESDTAFRGKATPGAIAPAPAPQTGSPAVNETITPQPEESVTEPVAAPQTAQKEVAKEPTAVSEPVVKKNTNTPAPQHKQAEEPATVAKKESPAPNTTNTPEETPQVAEQIPADTQTSEAVAQQADTAQQKDYIGDAIRKRGPGTVMNVIRSRYADSMEQVEKELAKQQGEEESAEDTTLAQAPVIATAPDTTIDVAKEITPVAPDTIDALAIDALNQTEQNMLVRQDAIPGANIKVPVETPAFEEPETIAANAESTQTADPEKGSLAAFIGPSPRAESYTSAWTGIDAAAPYKVRQPLTLDAFMKLGMETGVKANKFVFAPSLQARLSDRFSLVLQPAIKGGRVNFSRLGNEQSFYSIESSYMDSLKTYTTGHNAQGIIFDSVRATYFYQESYDSLVISHNLNSTTLLEAELPLMLNYNVTKQFSIYGGPMVTWSNMLLINENTDRYKIATRRDTITYAVAVATEAPPATPIREVFTYSGKEISEYNPVPYANPSVSRLRLGYMLGISYNYKRFSADLSVQQNLSRLNYIPNAAIKNIYMQPYTRFMIGYQLNNRKK